MQAVRIVCAIAVGAALGASSALFASTAGAFCRTTTCDVSNPPPECPANPPPGCNTEGKVLFWAGKCLSFAVQEDGSPSRNITADTLDGAVRFGFQQWLGAGCSGGTPSFTMFDLDEATGPVACNELQFNRYKPNANVWMFRDDEWPYNSAANTLALTTITTNVKTGEILDADVEINSFIFDFSASPGGPGPDLQAVVTHEAGHFLGLAHESAAEATMNPNYELASRTIHPDDVDGICTIYPPERRVDACSGPNPRNGFSPDCQVDIPPPDQPAEAAGCQCRSAGGPVRGAPFVGIAVAMVFVLRRARSTRALPLGLLEPAHEAGGKPERRVLFGDVDVRAVLAQRTIDGDVEERPGGDRESARQSEDERNLQAQADEVHRNIATCVG